jgi:hypothetical protein
LAADLAVFNVLLAEVLRIEQDANRLPAIRAVYP